MTRCSHRRRRDRTTTARDASFPGYLLLSSRHRSSSGSDIRPPCGASYGCPGAGGGRGGGGRGRRSSTIFYTYATLGLVASVGLLHGYHRVSETVGAMRIGQRLELRRVHYQL